MGNDTVARTPAGLETEADAYAFLERLRWGSDGPTECPHCGSAKGAWYLKPKDPEGRKSKGGSAARSQRRVWKCRENSCRRQFSVLTNTVLHATKMPVRAWVGAIFDLCEDRDGVSARDIARRWDVTEKSAWAMLNRIQDALAEPEAAGASLGSNAPLWYELAPQERATIEQQKREREQAAAEAQAAQAKAKSEAAARVERDVQRALRQAAEQQSDTTSELETRETTAASDPKRLPPSRVSDVALAVDSDVSDQVKSDVERALAEVFGDTISGQGEVAPTPTQQPDLVPNPPAEKPPTRPISAMLHADSEPTVPADEGAPDSISESEADGETQLESAKKRDRTGAKLRRRKRKKRAKASGDSQPESHVEQRPQPGDNAATGIDNNDELEPTSGAIPPSRARVRRARSRPQEVPETGTETGSDSLGGGWLDTPPQAPREADQRPSSEQGQLAGIAAAELGPAWASTTTEESPEAAQEIEVSGGQLGLFADPVDDTE